MWIDQPIPHHRFFIPRPRPPAGEQSCNCEAFRLRYTQKSLDTLTLTVLLLMLACLLLALTMWAIGRGSEDTSGLLEFMTSLPLVGAGMLAPLLLGLVLVRYLRRKP